MGFKERLAPRNAAEVEIFELLKNFTVPLTRVTEKQARLTLTLFDVRPAAESVCAESTPAYGRFGAGNLEAARAVSVPGALTSKRCISARDDKEIQANDVR